MYDAFLLLGFGGPESPDEVMPFLRHVTAGRNVPDERLLAVAEHYHHFGGVSPINAQNRALLAALGDAFAAQGIDLPLYWGNRNSAPWLADTVATMAADGVTRALVLATSATGGYSGCRQYRENLRDAAATVDSEPPSWSSCATSSTTPASSPPTSTAYARRWPGCPTRTRRGWCSPPTRCPVSMNDTAGPEGGLYLTQQRETARLVAEALRGPGAPYDLVWQSRSGPPQVPWLEPDINDHLRLLAKDGVTSVVVAPTGFVSDHLEVLWDLDNEAAETAAEVGITLVRAGTAGTHPAVRRRPLRPRPRAHRRRAAARRRADGPVLGRVPVRRRLLHAGPPAISVDGRRAARGHRGVRARPRAALAALPP